MSGMFEGEGICLYTANYCNIANNTCSNNNIDGISLYHSNNNSISKNTCSYNGDCGIYLSQSNKNSISMNTCSNNDGRGIRLWDSNSSKIYLSNFINNVYNVSSSGSINTWNSMGRIRYNYTGKTYTNYLGNYVGDYNGKDAGGGDGGDGIGDTHYQIDGDWDKYPLMKPWEEYVGEIGSLILTVSKTQTKGFINLTIKLEGPKKHFFVLFMANGKGKSYYKGSKCVQLDLDPQNRQLSEGQLGEDGTAKVDIHFRRDGSSPKEYWFQAISAGVGLTEVSESDLADLQHLFISNCEKVTVPY